MSLRPRIPGWFILLGVIVLFCVAVLLADAFGWVSR